MNARRKIRFRAHQHWVRLRDLRALNPGAAPTDCRRCGKPFKSEWLDKMATWCPVCETCQARNLFDGLGLPTPPELLDRHTLIPTLTKREYDTKLKSA